jgi:type II secretory pathway component PulK
VTALPKDTKINVCTAKDKVLDAFLGAGHTEFSTDQGALAKNRTASSGCFPTLSNYQAAFPQQRQKIVANYFQQNSSYFRLTSYITIGSAEFSLYSLLYQDATFSVRPIQRSFTPE